MRLAVNLDTGNVVTLPTPFRLKLNASQPLSVGFVRDGAFVSLDRVEITVSIGGLSRFITKATGFTPIEGSQQFTGVLDTTPKTRLNQTISALSAAHFEKDPHSGPLWKFEVLGEVSWDLNGVTQRSNSFPVVIERDIA